jgi:hypothetical protein
MALLPQEIPACIPHLMSSVSPEFWEKTIVFYFSEFSLSLCGAVLFPVFILFCLKIKTSLNLHLRD